MKKKGIIVALVLLVIGGGGLVYLSLMSSPKAVFATSLKNNYTQMSEMLGGFSEGRRASMGDDAVIQSKTTMDFELVGDFNEFPELAEINEFLEDIKLEYVLQEDWSAEKMFLELSLLFSEDESLDFNMFLEQDWMYVLFDELFDKYIGFEGIDIFQDSKDQQEMIEDFDYLIDTLTDLVIDSFLDEYFTSEQTTITIEGEEHNVTKNSLFLDSDRMNEILTFVIQGLLDDDKALGILEELLDIEKSEIVKELESELERLENASAIENNLTYNIYTKGITNDDVFHEIIIEIEDYWAGKYEVKLIYYALPNEDNGHKFLLMVDDLIVELIMYEENGKRFYSIMSFVERGQLFKLEIEVEINEEEVTAQQEYNIQSNYKINIDTADFEMGLIINVDTNLKVIDEVFEPERGLLVKYDDLSEEDLQKIEELMSGLLGGVLPFANYENPFGSAAKGAFESTARGMEKSAETEFYRRALMAKVTEDVYYVFKDGGAETYSSLTGEPSDVEVFEYYGNTPKNGVIHVKTNGDIRMWLHDGRYCVTKDFMDTLLTVNEDIRPICEQEMPLYMFE